MDSAHNFLAIVSQIDGLRHLSVARAQLLRAFRETAYCEHGSNKHEDLTSHASNLLAVRWSYSCVTAQACCTTALMLCSKPAFITLAMLHALNHAPSLHFFHAGVDSGNDLIAAKCSAYCRHLFLVLGNPKRIR